MTTPESSLPSFVARAGHAARAGLRWVAALFRRLIYSARAWVLFVVLVIALLAAYYVLSDLHTPFTTDAYVQAYVVQVAPRIEGQVVRVLVEENQPVKKGDLLFEIDPRPFEYRLELLKAKRVDAVQQVAQLEAELAAAKADIDRLLADEAYAKVVADQEKEIFKQEATTDRKYQQALQTHKAAVAARKQAVARAKKVEQALAAMIGDEHAIVAEVQSQIEVAKLDLEWTRVYAPANGFVTNVQLREGDYIHVGAPAITCIDSDHWWVVANFRENALENVQQGQRVGLTINTYPGRIFPGIVDSIGWGVDQGQGAPSGELPSIGEPKNWIRLAQRFQVRIIPEMPPEYPLRVGATASAAIYTRDEYWLNDVTHLWQRIEAALDHFR
ncbi:MAG: HlyD family secretion protein [Pirellulales bacterium]